MLKLHRCRNEIVRIRAHQCHRVQKPLTPRGSSTRSSTIGGGPNCGGPAASRKLPVIEFEDGATCREESKDMAARIAAGRLAGGPSDVLSGS